MSGRLAPTAPSTNVMKKRPSSSPCLCTLRVADSVFHGYVCSHSSFPSIERFRRTLIEVHPGAAHVPYAALLASSDEEGVYGEEQCDDDDGEPAASHVGMTLLKELNWYQKQLRRQCTVRIRRRSGNDANGLLESDDGNGEKEEEESRGDGESGVATAIIVVRYVRNRLLGVTCGRLQAVYQRTARLTLHRHLMGKDAPFAERLGKGETNLYGLGAGDAELILDVVPPSLHEGEGGTVVQRLLSELQFEPMVGSRNEPLPRLQNLQADLLVVGSARSMERFAKTSNTLVPVYRYPGNYSGTEWPTHPWSRTSLAIKRLAEEALRPLYNQNMNHCVANLYSDGSDRIDRHSDKDLDLNRDGAIVSVSLGSSRVLELRDRDFPHDIARVEIPPRSMFVLGPFTNARFTHAVLPSKVDEEDRGHGQFGRSRRGATDEAECRVEEGGRISLTFRDVRTFLDVKTHRLLGQGIGSSSGTPILSKDGVITEDSMARAVQSTRDKDRGERRCSMLVAAGIGAVAGYAMLKSSDGSGAGGAAAKSVSLHTLRSISTGTISMVSYWYLQRTRDKIRQQREEREARAFFSKKSASGNKY